MLSLKETAERQISPVMLSRTAQHCRGTHFTITEIFLVNESIHCSQTKRGSQEQQCSILAGFPRL